MSFIQPAGAEPWTIYMVQACTPWQCWDDELSQVFIEGSPSGGSIDPGFLEPPTLTQPATPGTTHPLHDEIAWILYDTEVHPTLIIAKDDGVVAWIVEAATDATSLVVPALPSTANEATLLGAEPLTARLTINRERGIRYAHAAFFQVRP